MLFSSSQANLCRRKALRELTGEYLRKKKLSSCSQATLRHRQKIIFRSSRSRRPACIARPEPLIRLKWLFRPASALKVLFHHVPLEADRVADFCAKTTLTSSFSWTLAECSNPEFLELVINNLDSIFSFA
ncbi:hypothetical protein KSP39_PZI002575 [Platanthera zijinensis]|uniref:Uncharacterized protein n=1 Tax=Platanthera zijinensis TaxID=2320716 RepID=A0AAP0BXP6_9ASPA